jgi:hypothetical protein
LRTTTRPHTGSVRIFACYLQLEAFVCF